jgi:hypothetical protein
VDDNSPCNLLTHRLSDTVPAAASTADSVIGHPDSCSSSSAASSARSSAALQLRALKCTAIDAVTSVLTSALTVQASVGPIAATVTRQLVWDTAACVARQRSSAARQHGFSSSSSSSRSSVDNSATAANGCSDAPKADVGDPSAPPWQIVLQQISIECEAAASGDSSAAATTAGVLVLTDTVLHYSAQNSDDSSFTAAQIEVLARSTATAGAGTAAGTDNTEAVHTDTALVCIADVIMSRESAPDAAAAAADTTAAGDLQQEPLFTAHATAGSVHAVISPQLMALVSSVRSHMQCFSASELLQRRDRSATTIDAAASATATAATSSRACQSVLVQASEVTVSTDGGASKRGTAANVSISLLHKHCAGAASTNSSTASKRGLEVAVGQQYVCVLVDKPGQPLQVRSSIFKSMHWL